MPDSACCRQRLWSQLEGQLVLGLSRALRGNSDALVMGCFQDLAGGSLLELMLVNNVLLLELKRPIIPLLITYALENFHTLQSHIRLPGTNKRASYKLCCCLQMLRYSKAFLGCFKR